MAEDAEDVGVVVIDDPVVENRPSTDLLAVCSSAAIDMVQGKEFNAREVATSTARIPVAVVIDDRLTQKYGRGFRGLCDVRTVRAIALRRVAVVTQNLDVGRPVRPKVLELLESCAFDLALFLATSVDVVERQEFSTPLCATRALRVTVTVVVEEFVAVTAVPGEPMSLFFARMRFTA